MTVYTNFVFFLKPTHIVKHTGTCLDFFFFGLGLFHCVSLVFFEHVSIVKLLSNCWILHMARLVWSACFQVLESHAHICSYIVRGAFDQELHSTPSYRMSMPLSGAGIFFNQVVFVSNLSWKRLFQCSVLRQHFLKEVYLYFFELSRTLHGNMSPHWKIKMQLVVFTLYCLGFQEACNTAPK